MDPATGPKRLKLVFACDAQHRRIAKVVKEWASGAATGGFTNVVKDRRYVYDGWNMIAESSRGTEARWTDGAADCPGGVRAREERPNQLDHTTATGTGLAGASVVRTQVWGQDLSGTMQGAEGVGGLLAVRHGGQTYVPLMDGNSNVMGLQGLGGAKDGQTVARYDYDAFGNRITNTAPELGEEVNPFGFSTKFTDEETGLVYYGFRYYSPEMGRWLNRDPIAERGGVNLYGMVGNNAVNFIDYLGLAADNCYYIWIDVLIPRGEKQARPSHVGMGHAPSGNTDPVSMSGTDMYGNWGPDGTYDPKTGDYKGKDQGKLYECCCLSDEEYKKLKARIEALKKGKIPEGSSGAGGNLPTGGYPWSNNNSPSGVPYNCGTAASMATSGLGCAPTSNIWDKNPSDVYPEGGNGLSDFWKAVMEEYKQMEAAVKAKKCTLKHNGVPPGNPYR